MELAEKRYEQWLAQQGLEPELRAKLGCDAVSMQRRSPTRSTAIWSLARQACAALGAGTNRMNVHGIRRATEQCTVSQ